MVHVVLCPRDSSCDGAAVQGSLPICELVTLVVSNNLMTSDKMIKFILFSQIWIYFPPILR